MSYENHIQESWYKYLKIKYDMEDEELEQYIDAFYDINNGNSFGPTLLSEFIKNETDEKISIETCRNGIKEINKSVNNKNRTIIDLRTFMLYIVPLCHTQSVIKMNVKELFESLDTNQDGKLSCTEFISILYKIDKKITPEKISDFSKQIKDICNKLDTDGDGYISYEEFRRFLLDKDFNTPRNI